VREHFIVFRHGSDFALRHHVHHLVAARLELAEQFRQCIGGVVEVMQQDHAFAVLLELVHHRLNHVFGLAQLEVARITADQFSSHDTPMGRAGVPAVRKHRMTVKELIEFFY
jgi:hypothetical protein